MTDEHGPRPISYTPREPTPLADAVQNIAPHVSFLYNYTLIAAAERLREQDARIAELEAENREAFLLIGEVEGAQPDGWAERARVWHRRHR